MAGGGRVKIKGGRASKGEVVVEDGAILVTGIAAAAGGRFQLPFYGEDMTAGVTAVELMEENTDADMGIPIARAVSTGNVAVKFRRQGAAVLGDWTLRLFRNGVQVATFAVSTN
jgi:hypothetical protein